MRGEPLIKVIANRVLDLLGSTKLTIDDFCVCLRAAYVVVRDGLGRRAIGVAHIPYDELHQLGEPRAPCIECVVDMVVDLNTVNRVLGLATVNALSQYLMVHGGLGVDLDFNRSVLDLISEGPVCVVGRMEPLIRAIESRGFTYFVFEKSSAIRGDAYSEVEEELLIPRCRVNIITGMALLNFTIDRLLELSRGFNVITGPSASLPPSALKGLKIHAVASTLFTDIDRVKTHLKLGNHISLITHRELGKQYRTFIPYLAPSSWAALDSPKGLKISLPCLR